ncbi:MAG: hypothetical protein KF696_03745 [Planctomycetes bacterium]|nr:hypothetical protein [Planctomycetota bacterium]MCW8134083.1 hypothetical protein [Planctomycetota bacterium]
MSEIARRTECPVSSIHGYLHGTRIPADVLARIAVSFQVNPAWLLTGDGAPWTADVAPGTATMAADVLQLVAAMEGVSKLKLGAISGKQPVVRELDDALTRHEQLSARLNRRSNEALEALINDANRRIGDRDLDGAQALMHAASRLLRLSADPAMRVQVGNIQAILARLAGRPAEALERYRDAFLASLPARAQLGQDSFVIAWNYANALSLSGQVHESSQVCHATLLLGDAAVTSKPATLAFQLGWNDLWRGEMRSALARMAEWLPHIGGVQSQRVETPKYMYAQLLAGLLEPATAMETIPDSPNKGGMLAAWGFLHEDAELLSAVYQRFFGGDPRFTDDAGGKLGGKATVAGFTEAMLRVLKRKDRKAPAAYEQGIDYTSFPGRREYHEFTVLVNACQLARLAGLKSRARKRHESASAALAAMDRSLTPPPHDVARHWRNALALDTPDAAQAREWFRDWSSRGYLCFRPWAA